MKLPINHSTMENFERLQNISSAWTQAYNEFLSKYQLEDWEYTSIYDMILSEKVFDI